jgi:hypothetical protein
MKSYAFIDELADDDIDLVIVNTQSRRITNTLKKFIVWKTCRCRKAFDNGRTSSGIGSYCKEKKSETVCFSKRRWDSDFKPYKKIISDEVWAILWKPIPF